MTADNAKLPKEKRMKPDELKVAIYEAVEASSNIEYVPEVKKMTMFKIFDKAECQDALTKFDTAELFNNSPRVLQLFIPPLPQYCIHPLKYEPQTARDYIELVYQSSVYHNPIRDLFDILAYYIKGLYVSEDARGGKGEIGENIGGWISIDKG
jgi:hypothetical protein